MANFNKVILIGNLTRDPELRYTPSGTAVVNLRLAANHRFKDKSGELKQEACFITVVVWDKQAETCNQYLQKGSSVLVEGRLQSRSWKDNNSGQNRNVIEVRADRVVFLTSASQRQKVTASAKVAPETEANPNGASSNEALDDVSWSKDIDEQLS